MSKYSRHEERMLWRVLAAGKATSKADAGSLSRTPRSVIRIKMHVLNLKRMYMARQRTIQDQELRTWLAIRMQQGMAALQDLCTCMSRHQ